MFDSDRQPQPPSPSSSPRRKSVSWRSKKNSSSTRPITSSYDPEEDDPSLRDTGLRYRTLTRSKSSVFLPRLVERNLTYHQSKNNISVNNINGKQMIWPLLMRDWFHVLLRLPFRFSILGLLLTWTAFILAFAGLYVLVDKSYQNIDCGLGAPDDPIAWGTAFAFSLETCTTVGYGLPGGTNAFFEANCPQVQITIFFQMMWSMMFNAFLFAFFYSTLSKCESRGTQVVFSNKVIIKEDKATGKILISSRCYDVDAQFPVVEAHVRMYVMDRRLKLHLMRMQEPDDDMGGVLHISVPTELKHHVDHHSPLSPRGMPLVVDSAGLCLRSADSAAGNRDEIECPVCAEVYGTYDRLWRHVQFQKMIEEREEYPIPGTHQAFVMPDITPISLQEVKTYMESFMSEIIVVIEGIDPQVSGTFQALQSYKYEDIAWEGEFEPCLKVLNSKFCVDLAKFHQVRMPLSPPMDIPSKSDPERGGMTSTISEPPTKTFKTLPHKDDHNHNNDSSDETVEVAPST